jgi:hypothetical protein
MGGDLVVESAVGVGSTFTLTLALTMPIQAPTATGSSPRLSEMATLSSDANAIPASHRAG